MKLLTAIAVVALTGCSTVGGLSPSGGVAIGAAISKAERVADSLLNDVEGALCNKRFSLRAYEQHFRGRVATLADLCGWGKPTEDLLFEAAERDDDEDDAF